MKHSRRYFSNSTIPVLLLFALALVGGCAAAPVQNSFTDAMKHWRPDDPGLYIHSSGRVISEDAYTQLVAREVGLSLRNLSKQLPQSCKRGIP